MNNVLEPEHFMRSLVLCRGCILSRLLGLVLPTLRRVERHEVKAKAGSKGIIDWLLVLLGWRLRLGFPARGFDVFGSVGRLVGAHDGLRGGALAAVGHSHGHDLELIDALYSAVK